MYTFRDNVYQFAGLKTGGSFWQNRRHTGLRCGTGCPKIAIARRVGSEPSSAIEMLAPAGSTAVLESKPTMIAGYVSDRV